ncbi:MAG: hypothetical protein EOO94_02765, partial [Pedobacter sp.]
LLYTDYDATLAVYSTIDFDGGTFEGSGKFRLNGTLNVDTSFILPEALSMIIEGGSVNLGADIWISGNKEFNGNIAINRSGSTGVKYTFGASGNTIVAPGTNISVNHCYLSNSGVMTLNVSSSNIFFKLNDAGFNNQSELIASGGGTVFIQAITNAASYTNRSMQATDNSTFNLITSTAPFTFSNASAVLSGGGKYLLPDSYTTRYQDLHARSAEPLVINGVDSLLTKSRLLWIELSDGSPDQPARAGKILIDRETPAGGIYWFEIFGTLTKDEYEIVRITNGKLLPGGHFSAESMPGNYVFQQRDSSIWLIKRPPCIPVVFYRDSDGDRFGNASDTVMACFRPDGYTTDSTDCNDRNRRIYPGAPETFNGVDDDCNGLVDDLPTYHFRTMATGNWNSIATWEFRNAGVWRPADRLPVSLDSSVMIRTHMVLVNSRVDLPSLNIAAGGTLTVDEGSLILHGATNIIEGSLNIPKGSVYYSSNAHIQYLTIRGVLNFTGGTINTAVVNYGTATISGADNKLISSIFYNRGTLNLNNTSYKMGSTAGYINNLGANSKVNFNSSTVLQEYSSSGAMRNLDGATITFTGSNKIPGLETNAKIAGTGTVIVTSFANTGTIAPGYVNGTSTNPGTLAFVTTAAPTGVFNLNLDINAAGSGSALRDQYRV